MRIFVLAVHIIIAVLVVCLILLQSSQGGLTRSFSGGDLYRSKRGAERIVFLATIVLCALFFITSILNLILG